AEVGVAFDAAEVVVLGWRPPVPGRGPDAAVARPLGGRATGRHQVVRRAQLSLLLAPRRFMPRKMAPPPTTTRAAAMPAMRPVLELAPVSARWESPVAGDGALLPVSAGGVLSLGVGVPVSSAGVEAESDGVGSGFGGVVSSCFLQAVAGVVRFGLMSSSTYGRALTWMRYSAFGFQSSSKVMVTPSREPLTTCSPTFFSSAPLFSR